MFRMLSYPCYNYYSCTIPTCIYYIHSYVVLVTLIVFILQEFVTEAIEVKAKEFEALKGNTVPLKQ